MKPMQQPIVLLAIVIAACTLSCNNSSDKKTERKGSTTTETTTTANDLVFDKMLGTWQSEDGKSFERWTKNDKGGYNSAAYSLKGADTSWNEQANIYLENSNWVFEKDRKSVV